MSDLESALTALEARIERTLKATKALGATIGRLRAAAKDGCLTDIEKALPVVRERADEAVSTARDLAETWTFDAAGYLDGGRFFHELQRAARSAGLQLFEKDGRIYCFPLLLRVESKDAALRIGKKLERRIRPRRLADALIAMQKRPQRFKEHEFLNVLYRTYRRMAGVDWRKSQRGMGPVIPVAELHETLTLLPDSDYPIEEFGRDLLLLDRKPDLRTRDGARFEFPKATIGKERVKRVAVYDEDGRERLYIGLRFIKET